MADWARTGAGKQQVSRVAVARRAPEVRRPKAEGRKKTETREPIAGSAAKERKEQSAAKPQRSRRADRKIRDRKMGFLLIFLSLIFLSAALPLGFLAACEQSRLLQYKETGQFHPLCGLCAPLRLILRLALGIRVSTISSFIASPGQVLLLWKFRACAYRRPPPGFPS